VARSDFAENKYLHTVAPSWIFIKIEAINNFQAEYFKAEYSAILLYEISHT